AQLASRADKRSSPFCAAPLACVTLRASVTAVVLCVERPPGTLPQSVLPILNDCDIAEKGALIDEHYTIGYLLHFPVGDQGGRLALMIMGVCTRQGRQY